ncbi:hypothetical protein SARC_05197 [Sphaeroforma arctica JP610]|uniref:Acyltransferase C-terminal domain-containing protein n=1 Tax=Sphaeroforma arctica JP610 TaxID=667725 RepID=A0A0L0G115_9EUKA|nr:hypothetical protein SARC_05197 [Sphaeroforma arctica JP610]KNC82524.1 hypothetical protein SARC_05197 [Sphaeroforma arctica JP610]|eukprot:XP_014156426.1 hypothetical protein SARC_05197 [Sphaeroforma arctica JP610]
MNNVLGTILAVDIKPIEKSPFASQCTFTGSSPELCGFSYTVSCIRDDIDTIYDVTLAFKDNKRPTMAQLLKGEGGEVHVYLERYDPKDLPRTEPELLEWLNASFKKKDALLDYHEKHGVFEGVEKKVEVTTTPLYITGFWFASFMVGTSAYFLDALANSEWYKFKIAGGITVALFGALAGLLRYSEADKTKVEKGQLKKKTT